MNVSESFHTGVNFGLTSGVITTLGVMVGLHSGTHSTAVIVGAIITIAIADAFADALGIHVHEESENVHTTDQIWAATAATLVTKLLMAGSFLIPVLTLQLTRAIMVSIVWGGVVLAVLSYRLAKTQGRHPGKVIAEHLLIACLVVAITHAVGEWVGRTFL